MSLVQLLADYAGADAVARAARGAPDPEDLLAAFAGWAADIGHDLYPAQQDALLELAADSHVILATPTGSGKSLVAVGAIVFTLAAAGGPTTRPRSKRWSRRSSSTFATCWDPRTSGW